MISELKPCPFCGGKAVPPNDRDHHVSCSKCGASGANWAEYDSAIEAWNKRAERTCHMERVLLYDEEGVEGIRCTECEWTVVHDWRAPLPNFCSNCSAKVVSE